MRCAAHTLNLICTTDADKALTEDKPYSRIYHGSFAKCQALWNAVKRSSKAADTVKEICSGKMIICPCPTRWNSKFDAVSRLLELNDKLSAICDALNIPRLKPVELDFLTEYHLVMQPVAAALDSLQGDSDCFYGMLLPKLVQLRNKLKSLETGSESYPDLQHAKPLISAILSGMTCRYEDLLPVGTSSCSKGCHCGSCVTSQIQATVGATRVQRRDDWNICCSCNKFSSSRTQCTGTGAATSATTSSDEDYGYQTASVQHAASGHVVDNDTLVETRANRARVEALNFLEDRSKVLQTLSNYKNVCSVFLKYNTCLPSSAPVERLFSIGGLILTPRRNSLSDAAFQQLLMLKTNSSFVNSS